ncbi:MAG: ABC transporter permease [Candidatus Aminicenantes bacterium]|nr:ABC transporter permease [Candidatus Aminicenantes bacterium]
MRARRLGLAAGFSSIRPIIRKEFRQIRRDPRTLIFLLALPGFLLLMYGYALNFDFKHIPMAVCDQDRSPESRDFLERLGTTEYFDIRFRLDDPRQVDGLFGLDKARVAVVVPRGFAEDLASAGGAEIQVLLDGTNATSAGTAAGYIAAIVQGASIRMTTRVLDGRGFRGPALPVQAEVRVWYNPELRSALFLVPGLMAFILMIIVVISTAFSIVREKERGTMEQILVSPVRPFALIVGKTVPYVLISLLSAHLVLGLGWILFGVPIRGSYPLLLLVMGLFLLGGLGQGILISTVTRTQQVAFMISILTTFLPTFILSGFVFPIRNMPGIIRAVSALVPARYFLSALRDLMIKGVGIAAFWDQMLFLAAFAILTIVVSTARLRRTSGEERVKGRAR